MFFSVNSPDFRKRVPYLEQFVLNKHTRNLPPDIGAYTGYTVGGQSGRLGCRVTSTAQELATSLCRFQFAFPPFLFVLTLDCPCPDCRLINISSVFTVWLRQHQDVRPAIACIANSHRLPD